jgi:segregation and condensation protein A
MSDEPIDPIADDAPDDGPARPAYRVQLDVFEGPLDLLLHLIKREEVEITEIPIAKITDQYLAYLDLMRDLSLDIAGEFLVMAATLTLIKSRMLLPSAEDDDEAEEDDPRANLVRQLLEYQRYREAAAQLAERPRLHREVFAREPAWDEVPPDPDALPNIRATMWDLLAAFREVLKRAQPDAVHEVVTERISLRDRVQSLLRTLSVAKSVDFESLFDEDATRLEIIVTFLALLELIRMQVVHALQERHFDRIVITLVVADASSVSLDLTDEYEGGLRERMTDGIETDGGGRSDGDGGEGSSGSEPDGNG